MSYDLNILQKPLDVTESHSDHTWNISLNDFSGLTDIRLIVDVYKNPYENDMGPNGAKGTVQDSGKAARLLVPVNEFGNCIFNVETIIRNFVKANPRNMDLIPTSATTQAITTPYNVEVYDNTLVSFTANTNQAVIANERVSNIGISNGFNGGYDGFENIYHINEYRLIFGVQYTSGGTSIQVIDTTNYNQYSGWTGQSINPSSSAAYQPYGVQIWPGVQDNKRYGISDNPAFNPYYQTDPEYNYHNYKVYNWAMDTGVSPLDIPGQFMATFGEELAPMTMFGGPVQQTRWRTHYYKCPIILPFMYGSNPLYDNSSVVKSVSFLQKVNNNNQLDYGVLQEYPVDYNAKPYGLYSYLGERIAYAIWKQNPLVRTQSDVAIFLSSGSCDPTYMSGVSEIVQYKMVGEECFNNPICFLFLNRNGVWDSYTFTKKSKKTYESERKTFQQYKTLNTRVWNRQSYDSAESVYYGNSTEIIVADSGFVLQNDAVVIEDFLLSPYVYMIMDNYTPEGQQTDIYPYLIPCTVQNKQVQVYQQKYQRIFQYQVELKQTPYRRYEMPI